MTPQLLLGLFSDEPTATQAVTVSPIARAARASGLRVARTKMPTQMLEYVAALKAHSPATDHEMATILWLPLATICGRRNDAMHTYPGWIEVAGRVVVHHPNGKCTSRCLWKWVGPR